MEHQSVGRLLHTLFVPSGTVSRAAYWKTVFGLIGGLTVLSLFGFATLPDPVLFIIIVAWPVSCLVAKRLRPSGYPGRAALLPLAVLACHFILIGLFSIFTLGGSGAGSGGGQVTRQIYRALEDLAEPHVYVLMLLGWIVWVGALPTREKGPQAAD